MPTSLVPFIGPLSFVLQVVWPIVVTVGVVSDPKGHTPHAIIQWTLYWMIYSLWSLLENTLLWWLVEYLPMYLEVKAVFFFWLVSPVFQGAGYLWYRVLNEYCAPHINRMREWYELRAPPALLNHLPATQTKVEPWNRSQQQATPSTTN